MKAGLDYSHGETIILGVHGPGADRYRIGAPHLAGHAQDRIRHPRRRVEHPHARRARRRPSYRATLVGSWSIGGPFTLAASYSADYQLGDIRRNLFRDERVLRHVVRVGVTVAPSFSRSFLPPDEAARAKGVSR